MKLYLLLGLLFLGVNGEKKINLDDIERDNLRTEVISKTAHARPEETKYLARPKIGQQQYQIQSQYNEPSSSPVGYVAPPSSQNVPPEAYVQFNKYAAKEQAYQQQNNILPEQTPPPQYYNEYQQQPPLPPRGVAPNIYESQQLAYQPEVPVGNQLQIVQQKTATAKYAKNTNKGIHAPKIENGYVGSEPVYVDIPMMHLLAYYPNLEVSAGKAGRIRVPQLTTAAAGQIAIPFYTAGVTQKPIVSVKPTFQIPYAPKYNSVAPPAYTTQGLKGQVYTTPVTSKKYTSVPLMNVPAYVPADQSSAQGRQLLYTQAYVAPQEPSEQQYVSQLVYTQPATIYMQATPVYSDIYARPPTYVLDNSLQGTVKYNAPAEQPEAAAPVADELPNQALVQQTSQTVSQTYVKDIDEPSGDLTPPRSDPQEFKFSTTPLAPVPTQGDESLPVQNHVGQSEPLSLLDTYVPSKVIAAQDISRYLERPIQLETGFLPSKENFLFKKHKTI